MLGFNLLSILAMKPLIKRKSLWLNYHIDVVDNQLCQTAIEGTSWMNNYISEEY